MTTGETFEQLVTRLAAEHPAINTSQVQRIVIEEHDLLTGLDAGDVVPSIVVEAAEERVQRLLDQANSGAEHRGDEVG